MNSQFFIGLFEKNMKFLNFLNFSSGIFNMFHGQSMYVCSLVSHSCLDQLLQFSVLKLNVNVRNSIGIAVQCVCTSCCFRSMLRLRPKLRLKLRLSILRQIVFIYCMFQVLDAFESHVRNVSPLREMPRRMSNLLLLLPPILGIARDLIEDVQLAKLFGLASIDRSVVIMDFCSL